MRGELPHRLHVSLAVRQQGQLANEQFSQVYGIAVDAVNGWVYAVDGAGRVEKSDLAGNVHQPVQRRGTLNEPRQVTVAPNSDVLVMNARNHECDVFNSDGTLLFTFGSHGTGNGQFTDDPRGVSVSQNGNMAFVTDSGGKRIEVFTLTSSGAELHGRDVRVHDRVRDRRRSVRRTARLRPPRRRPSRPHR